MIASKRCVWMQMWRMAKKVLMNHFLKHCVYDLNSFKVIILFLFNFFCFIQLALGLRGAPTCIKGTPTLRVLDAAQVCLSSFIKTFYLFILSHSMLANTSFGGNCVHVWSDVARLSRVSTNSIRNHSQHGHYWRVNQCFYFELLKKSFKSFVKFSIFPFKTHHFIAISTTTISWVVDPHQQTVTIAAGATKLLSVRLPPPSHSAPLAVVKQPHMQLALRRYCFVQLTCFIRFVLKYI